MLKILLPVYSCITNFQEREVKTPNNLFFCAYTYRGTFVWKWQLWFHYRERTKTSAFHGFAVQPPKVGAGLVPTNYIIIYKSKMIDYLMCQDRYPLIWDGYYGTLFRGRLGGDIVIMGPTIHKHHHGHIVVSKGVGTWLWRTLERILGTFVLGCFSVWMQNVHTTFSLSAFCFWLLLLHNVLHFCFSYSAYTYERRE